MDEWECIDKTKVGALIEKTDPYLGAQ